MEPIRYTALIRTYNSGKTLPETLASLRNQVLPPAAYVFVDSGSRDETLDMLPEGAVLHRFQGEAFNYSDALNQGLPYVETDYVLIISSHTAFRDRHAMAFALDLLAKDKRIGAAYFNADPAERLEHSLVDRTNFTGFNGVWNTCGVIRTALLRKRAFRSEVFSAEDQEWSKWLVESENKAIASIAGGAVSFNNPRKHLMQKRLDEYLAVALFVRPDMRELAYTLRVVYRILRPFSTLRERHFNLRLALGLIRGRMAGWRFS